MAVPTAAAGFQAGRLTANYGAAELGQVASGFTIEHVVRKSFVTGDVQGPDTPQDAVFQGYEVWIEFDLMEYDAAGVQQAIFPYINTTFGRSAGTGRLDVGGTAESTTLILTDTGDAGVPSENRPHTITCDNAIIAEGFPVELFLAPEALIIPIRMRLYPNASGQFFVLAAA